MIEKSGKNESTVIKACQDTESEYITHLKDSSLKLSPELLQEAARKLKEGLAKVPKSLFSPKLPPPYARSEHSRPLQFTRDGLHLMYFTETEYIKLNIKTSEIVQRRKLPRADLSPIFVDYKIWSQDDSKVLVFGRRKISYELGYQIYVYDIYTGEYAEISEDIRSHLNLSQTRNTVFVECFNPLINHQVIIREVNQRTHGRTTDPITENLYSWNYKIKSLRPFAKNLKPSGCCVIPISPYVVVLNQSGSRPSSRFRNDNLEITYMTVYQAKKYKKIITMKNSTQNQNAQGTDWKYSLQRNIAYFPFSQYTEKGRYKICLKYKNECFFVLDLLERKLNDDQMSYRKAQNTIAVYPSHLIDKTFLKQSKELIKGFTFIRTRVDGRSYNNLTGNRLRIFEESNLLVKIIFKFSSSPSKIEIQAYKLKGSQVGLHHQEQKAKKKKGRKKKEVKIYPLINTTTFELYKSFKKPFFPIERKRLSQPHETTLHVIRNSIQGNEAKEVFTVHKEVDLTTWRLKKTYLFIQRAKPKSFSSFYHEFDKIETHQTIYSKRPNTNFLSLSYFEKDRFRGEYPFFFAYDLHKKRHLVWRSRLNLLPEQVLVGMSTFLRNKGKRLLQDTNGILVVKVPSIILSLRPYLKCEYLDLENLKTSIFYAKFSLDHEKQIAEFIGVSRTKINQKSDQIAHDETLDSSSDESNKPNAIILREMPPHFVRYYFGSRSKRTFLEHFDRAFYFTKLLSAELRKKEVDVLSKRKDQFQRNPTSCRFSRASEGDLAFSVINDELFGFTLDIHDLSISVKKLRQTNITEIEGEWKIGLDTIDEFEAMFGERLEGNDNRVRLLNLRYFEIIKTVEAQGKNGERVLDVDLLVVRGLWGSGSRIHSFHKSKSMVIYLRLYLENSKKDFSEENDEIHAGPGYTFSFDCFSCPLVPDYFVSHALVNREHSVVEIFEDTFWNLKKNSIHQRDYEGELKELYKKASEVTRETVVEVLISLVSLGYQWKELIDQLGLKQILTKLGDVGGWKEGIKYLNEEFDIGK